MHKDRVEFVVERCFVENSRCFFMFHKMLQQLSCDPFNATKEKWFPWLMQHNFELLGWYECVMVFDVRTAIWRAFWLLLHASQCCEVLHIKRATRTSAVRNYSYISVHCTFSVRSFYCGNSHIKQLIFFIHDRPIEWSQSVKIVDLLARKWKRKKI